MYDDNFNDYINSVNKETNNIFELADKDFKKILETMCNIYTEYYPDRKIYISEKLGKRISFVIGSGKELYIQPVKIMVQDKYIVFIESHEQITSRELEVLGDLLGKLLEKSSV